MLIMFSGGTSDTYCIFIANPAKGDRLHQESMGTGWSILERRKVGDHCQYDCVNEVDYLLVCLMGTIKFENNCVEYIWQERIIFYLF